MHDLTASVPFLHVSALAVALSAALGPKAQGVRCAIMSSNVPITWTPAVPPAQPVQNNGTCYLQMDDTAQPADDAAAFALAAAHDPVFLSVDKTTIRADGSDLASITVSAPKSGAAAVVIVCTQPSGVVSTQPVVLTAGVGTVQLKTVISGDYVFTVQNPANRSTDTITVKAS